MFLLSLCEAQFLHIWKWGWQRWSRRLLVRLSYMISKKLSSLLELIAFSSRLNTSHPAWLFGCLCKTALHSPTYESLPVGAFSLMPQVWKKSPSPALLPQHPARPSTTVSFSTSDKLLSEPCPHLFLHCSEHCSTEWCSVNAGLVNDLT